jgi:hypothetical protein
MIYSVGEEQGPGYALQVEWSPMGVSRYRRCLLAVLTTNHKVHIFEPVGHVSCDMRPVYSSISLLSLNHILTPHRNTTLHPLCYHIPAFRIPIVTVTSASLKPFTPDYVHAVKVLDGHHLAGRHTILGETPLLLLETIIWRFYYLGSIYILLYPALIFLWPIVTVC